MKPKIFKDCGIWYVEFFDSRRKDYFVKRCSRWDLAILRLRWLYLCDRVGRPA